MGRMVFVISNGVMGDTGFLDDQIRRAGDPILICTDGAAQKLMASDITPDYIVGDMDSIDEDTLRYFEAKPNGSSKRSWICGIKRPDSALPLTERRS